MHRGKYFKRYLIFSPNSKFQEAYPMIQGHESPKTTNFAWQTIY